MQTSVLRGYTRTKHRKPKSGLSGHELEIGDKLGNSGICTEHFLNDGWNVDEWTDCWSFNEWNDDWSSVGWHEGWEQTYRNSASSFSVGGLDVRSGLNG